MSTQKNRQIVAGLIAAAIAVTAAGCAKSSSSTDSAGGGGSTGTTGTLNVGQLGSSKISEALFAASGEDKGMTYKVNYSLFPGGGPGFIEASRSGSVDLASMADTPPIFGQASNAPVTIIAAQHTVAATNSVVEILVPKGSTATTLADLKGKKVAITQGTILQYTVIQALKKVGLTYKDIKPVNLTPPDALTAFKKGSVDAIAALDPQRSLLLATGARKIGDGVGVTAGLGYLVATNAALADTTKRAEIIDYVKRFKAAEAWADAHGTEWAQKYAALTGLPLPVAQAIVDREQDTFVPIDQTVISAQQQQADTYTALGLLPSKLDVSKEFNTQFNATFTGSAS